MPSRFGRFWKKPERVLHHPRDLESEHFPPRTQALPQPLDGMKVEQSPLREEAKKFWYHFMFRKSPASQGVILPIKSHEVHQETCRTVPFTQVCILGGEQIRACGNSDSWDGWRGGEEDVRSLSFA
jgi:cerberus 1